MGVAAYNRGSLAISRGMCAEYGCRGCVRCSDHTPTPRPPGWGDKIKAKARTRAAGLLRYMLERGHEITRAELADMIRQDVGCGKKTAMKAAEHAFSESG